MGKQTKINNQSNNKLKVIFKREEIERCEVCNSENYLGYAHRHKRIWYRGQPELLSDFNQVLLLCTWCHDIIENDKEATDKLFKRLRGE